MSVTQTHILPDDLASRVSSSPTNEAAEDPAAELLSELLPTQPTTPQPTPRGPLLGARMKVYLRVRPFTDAELAGGGERCFRVDAGRASVLARAPPDSAAAGRRGLAGSAAAAAASIGGGDSEAERVASRFAFSRVFDESVGQGQLYRGTVAGVVKQLAHGHSGLVFSYGVTSSGKTYTIQGTPERPGILPRALDALFRGLGDRLAACRPLPFRPVSFNEADPLTDREADAAIKETEALLKSDTSVEALAAARRRDSDQPADDDSSAVAEDCADNSATSQEEGDNDELTPDKRYSVWVSYAEIYNEVVYDLLEPISRRSRPSRTPLDLRTDRTGSVYVKGLRCVPVSSADEAYRLMILGKQNQQVAATRLNLQSSRSHSLFAIRLVHCLNRHSPQFSQVSSLTFCDLAGSERQQKGGGGACGPVTPAAGERTREAGSINASLLTLRRCVETLQYNQRNPKACRLVPFRDSKLTRLIQPYFSGSGRAAMIVNMSQCPGLFDETLSALRFSALARSVIVSEPTPKRLRIAADAAAAETPASPGFGVVSVRRAAPPDFDGDSDGGGGDACQIDRYDVTYADEEEAEMAEIAQCDKEELLRMISTLRQSRKRLEDEMEEREMVIRRELTVERDRLMANMEERFEQQLQQQREDLMDRHEERLREYLGTSERLAEHRLERYRQRFESLRLKVSGMEEKLGEARSESAQQEATISFLATERDDLLLRNECLLKQLVELRAAAKEAVGSELDLRLRRFNDFQRRLLDGDGCNGTPSCSAGGVPPGDQCATPNEPLVRFSGTPG